MLSFYLTRCITRMRRETTACAKEGAGYGYVVIKLGANCVVVDDVVDRFDFIVIFLCRDVHNKFRV